MNKIFTPSKNEFLSITCNELYQSYLISMKHKDFFTIVLSGGNTPRMVYNFLIEHYLDKINWMKVHFFWSDERCVPLNHQDSNYRLAHDYFLKFISPCSVNRIEGELSPLEAANKYQNHIESFFLKFKLTGFDFSLLGMGEDGHTASLFSDSDLSETRMVTVTKSSSHTHTRVSMGLNLLNNSTKNVLLVSNDNKYELFLSAENYPFNSLTRVTAVILGEQH